MPGFRFEDAISDALGGIFHAAPRAKQLGLGARGHDGNILFQVVKNQRAHGVSPLLLGGDRVERQLQALVGVFLIAGLAGLVVDDRHAAVGTAVDAVDASGDRGIADLNLKRLFGMQNLRGRERPSRGQKVAQLSDALLLVEFVLVGFLNLWLGQIEAEELDEFIVGLWPSEVTESK